MLECRIKTKAATPGGAEPEKEWDQIGNRAEGQVRSAVAELADPEPDDSWETISHRMEGKIRREMVTGLGDGGAKGGSQDQGLSARVARNGLEHRPFLVIKKEAFPR